MDQLYKRIEIKGEEKNLPKEYGEYFVRVGSRIDTWIFNPDDKAIGLNGSSKDVWMSAVEWYLIPFTPDSKAVIMPTAKDVEKEAYNYCAYPGFNGEPEFDQKSNNCFIDGAEWFRSQVREVELKSTDSVIVGPTEKEIKDQIYKSISVLPGDCTRSDAERKCYDVIDWYRSQLKTVNLKDELVKFCKTFNMNDTSEQIVDDYLSGKGKEDER